MKRVQWYLEQALRGMGLPGWVGASLAVVCALLWWGLSAPLAEEARRLGAESDAIERRLSGKRAEAPADATPQQQLEAFAQRFPAEKGIAQALSRLHAVARRNGVQLDQAEFRFASEAAEPLARYTMVLPVKADYRALRRFSRQALRELPGLALEEVNLRRADAATPVLEAQLRLVLFVTKAN